MRTIFKLVLAGLIGYPFTVPPLALAQIVPDESLGSERSVVSPSSTGDLISGGATRGSNLFHSFEDFNIQSGQGAYFMGSDDFSVIFSRVTGNNPSSILGRLGILNSNADLVFLNRNGIIFGPNASLELSGSFIGTTADSIQFADGTVLSSSEVDAIPILTSSIPVGLGFTSASEISVQDAGHTYIGNTFAPIQE
ncbi:MAG: filamentous hemagglutinin N-terminal domain-containing protein, partial [Cyanobacteria bacterium J06642_11]